MHEVLACLACFSFITILLLLSKNYVEVFTTQRCSGLDMRLNGNSTDFLVKVDFFAINGGVTLQAEPFLRGSARRVRRGETARLLYPNAQEESSPDFFSRIFSAHHFSETLTQLIVLFQVFKFFAASFYSVTSSITVTVFMVVKLALIDIQEMLPWQFCNFTCEIMN